MCNLFVALGIVALAYCTGTELELGVDVLYVSAIF